MGTAAAALGVVFTHGLDRFETLFSRLPLPACSKPAAGGFMVGIIGLLFPQVYGLGFETIGAALRGQLPLTLVAGLVVAKLAATFHAPITAVAIALELTGGYPLTLPLILACATSRFLALRLSPHAIYSLGLSRRGIDLQA